MRLTAAEIATRAGGEVVAGDPDVVVTSWGFDSRALAAGACFVALTDHRDGPDFVGVAFRAGAHAALVERAVPFPTRPDHPHALVRVPNVLRGLQAVARSVRTQRDGLVVIGVTGSTGKTSTKDLLAAALPPGDAFASPESYNNEFGLPITLLNTPAPAHVVVAEMGERFPGDVAFLCEIARPHFGVVTNVGLAHAEHLGGPEGIAAVLAELVEALPATGAVVLNADDPWTPWLQARSAARVETVGLAPDAAHRITDVEVDADLHPGFSLGGSRFRVGLRGAHQVHNAAMAAVAANVAHDVPFAESAARIADARGSRWRMELVETPDGLVVINDSYNANPASMDAALRALAHLGVEGRRIAVLGDMLELGAHSATAHQSIGRLARELGIDVLIGVGAGGAEIAGAARGSAVDVHTVADADGAVNTTERLARPGDAVLVKASRALGLQAVAAHLLQQESVT
jgi:UDP-N-acetylmuramoyl-tripeptide--D-alanyl-D-alanine ligase